MATGTGKTYTAFQIIWRLKRWAPSAASSSGRPQHPRRPDQEQRFQAVRHGHDQDHQRTADKAFEIYLALYQAVSGTEEEQNIYKQFSPGVLFDLVVSTSATGAAPQLTPPGARSSNTSTPPPRSASPPPCKETPRGLQHRLLGAPPIYTYCCARHRRRLPRPLQGHPHRHRQGPRRSAARDRQDRQVRPGDRGPRVQRTSITTAASSSSSAPPWCAARISELLGEGHRPLSRLSTSSSAKTSTTPSACARPWSTPTPILAAANANT